VFEQGTSKVKKILLTTTGLIALGMAPGRGLGRMLAEVRERQLQDELRTAEEALAWVKGQM